MNAPSFAQLAQQTSDGSSQVVWRVDGVHCAGCIGRIEHSLRDQPGVTLARLNFSTRRLSIRWQGSAQRADDFAKNLQDMGYTPHAILDEDTEKSEVQKLLFALGVAGFAMGNIMLLSLALWITDAQSMGPAMRDFLHLISAVIAVPAVMVAGRPFFASAWNALSHGRTNMDVPISVGLVLTLSMSLFELAQHGEHAYFDSAVMLTFFLLIGRYLDARVRARARSAAQDLLQIMNKTATILNANGTAQIIPVVDIQPGMVLLVAAGERVAADGVVTAAQAECDLSMITGESRPVTIPIGGQVVSGALNVGQSFHLRVIRAADQSFLADLTRLMEQAEQAQGKYVRLADRAARLYTPVVHILAVATFLVWVFVLNLAWQPALLIAATVLIITCPCALGLAVPVVQMRAISILLKSGIMVKSGDALERLAKIDTVVFDKTGTLTLGVPTLLDADKIAPDVLGRAASLAVHSQHPLSQAIVRAYHGPLIPLQVAETPGQGLQAIEEGRVWRLGRAAWCGLGPETITPETPHVWFYESGADPVLFTFDDVMRADAARVIQKLRARGLELHMLSGDHPDRAIRVGEQLNIQNIRGGCTPQDKFAYIEDLKRDGKIVWMVGDGLNDAPVLAAADVSLSPSTGIDIAQRAADMVWTGSSLSPVLTAYDVAVASVGLVRQNFALAILYNMVAIPAAMMGMITPLWAALAMSGSSMMVVANAARLRGGGHT